MQTLTTMVSASRSGVVSPGLSFRPGWFDENDLRLQYNTPHGRGGSRRGVNLSGLRWLP